MNIPVITIPIYKESPKPSEIASFRQCLTVLYKYNIAIITHKDCNLSIYKKIAEDIGKEIIVELFNSDFFKSVQGYNDLCFSAKLYNRFNKYEYMLIYQLDAWVFKDELQYWCDKGYDYIGAPIFYAYNETHFTKKFSGVGNGGFCLRRISHCLKMINANPKRPFIKPCPLIVLYWNFYLYSDKFKSLRSRLRIIPTVMVKIFGRYNNLEYYRGNHINEDMIFGSWSTKSWGFSGKIPSKEEAAKFSFEVNPKLLYHLNGDNLPFGCHAFEKWDYNSFWYKYIKL